MTVPTLGMLDKAVNLASGAFDPHPSPHVRVERSGPNEPVLVYHRADDSTTQYTKVSGTGPSGRPLGLEPRISWEFEPLVPDFEFARHTPNPERRGLEPGEVGKQEAETTVSILYCADNNRPIAQRLASARSRGRKSHKLYLISCKA